MSERSQRRESLDRARLAIARYRIEGDDGTDRAMRYVTRASAEKLACARVGVWLFVDEERTAIASPLVYDNRVRDYEGDCQLIEEAQCPSYFDALRGNRVISAGDARHDPATRELAAWYLVPRGIRALLDVPIYRGGEMIGVICHEADTTRTWSDDERAFATSVADMLAVVLEGARLIECERELRRTDRVLASLRHAEAVGRVAGALGHDLNNMLTVILAATNTLAPNNAAAQSVIRDAAERGVGLAKELLDLSRGHEGPSRAPAPGANVLERLRPVLGQLAEPHPIEWDVHASPEEIVADAQELERIAVNLVQNAKDASPPGAPIMVSARVVDEHFELSVRDRGAGMSADVMERAFDPFFTTKRHGNGLGLATVRAIATRRGGTIHVDSAPGRGTTFTIRFPVAMKREGSED